MTLTAASWRQRHNELCRELGAAEHDDGQLLAVAKQLAAWEHRRPRYGYREQELLLRISFDGIKFEEDCDFAAIAKLSRREHGLLINRLEGLALRVWQRYFP